MILIKFAAEYLFKNHNQQLHQRPWHKGLIIQKFI